MIQSLISQLQKQFPLKDLGNLGFFLGIQAHRTPDSLHLCQAKYVADLLHRTRMLGSKAARFPCSSGLKLSTFDGEQLVDPSEYRSVVGALQYCTLTRPDLSFAVNQLRQHLQAPTTTHWTAAKRVLRYLKDTANHGLLYSKGPLQLQAFCDSDWAGNPDERRSTSGFGVFLGNCFVSWGAKNSPWSLGQVLRPNIDSWPSLLLSSFGSACYLKSYEFPCLLLLFCGVTMLVPLP